MSSTNENIIEIEDKQSIVSKNTRFNLYEKNKTIDQNTFKLNLRKHKDENCKKLK